MFNSVSVELVSEMYYYYIYSEMAKNWCAICLTFPTSKTKHNKRKFCSILNAISWILCGWWLVPLLALLALFLSMNILCGISVCRMQNIIIMLHCEQCCCAIHYTLVTQNTTSVWQHFSSNEQFVSRSFKDMFEKYPNTEWLQEVCLWRWS